MVKIVVPSVWAPDGRTEFEGIEGPLPAVIRQFTTDNPDFRRRLLGPDAEPLTYVNFCLDDDLVPRHRRDTTVVEAGSTLTILTAMAGG
ncbi:hypothetical protein ACQP1K_14900 [Sphaerimonospora sp. CA-214678]|uniref:hypothetical protein n=1 Tax=Sphaerimonospora sp. CA-214678 TaxID=3240029 RepID=UPI003D946462